MNAPVRYQHTALHFADLRRSSAFYVEGLGLTAVERWRSGEYVGELFARRRVGVTPLLLATQDRTFLLELVQVDAAPPPVDPSTAAVGTAHVDFQVPDVSSLFYAYEAARLLVLVGPRGADLRAERGRNAVYSWTRMAIASS